MRRHTGEKKYRTSLEEEIECSETPPALQLRNVVQMCWLFNTGPTNAIYWSTPSTRFPSQRPSRAEREGCSDCGIRNVTITTEIEIGADSSQRLVSSFPKVP